MAKKLDPYTTLGIDRSASTAEVKSAYRQRAMNTHPDRGGNSDEFNRVNRANIVLSDPDRRSKYDRTGEIDDDSPNNVISAPLSIIIGFIQAACAQEAAGQGGDPLSADLVVLMKRQFRDVISKTETQKKQAVRIAAKMKKISDRLKARKVMDGLLNRSINLQADVIAANVAQADQAIKAHQDAITMLDEFTFENDPAPESRFPTSGFFQQRTW